MMIIHGAWVKEQVAGATPCLFLWGETSESSSGAVPPQRLRRSLADLSQELVYLGVQSDMTVFFPSENPLGKVSGFYFSPVEAKSVFQRLRFPADSQAVVMPGEDYAYWQAVYTGLARSAGEGCEAPVQQWARDMPDSACHIAQRNQELSRYVRPEKTEWLQSFIGAMRGVSVREALQGSGALQIFHTCLRLEEPELLGDSWRLTYWLQSAEDPSLLVSAADLWTVAGDHSHYLDGRRHRLRAQLLQDLKAAAHYFQPMAASLQDAYPTACLLNNVETQQLLAEQAERLREAGLSVQIPNWWRKNRAVLGVRLILKEEVRTGPGFLGVGALASYEMEASLGDQVICRSELEQIVALKTSLVRLAGQWCEIEPEKAAAALALIDRLAGKSIPLGQLLTAVAAGDTGELDPEETVALPIVHFEAPDKLRALMAAGKARDAGPNCAMATPPEFQGVLRPYQSRGLAWLTQLSELGLGACLADDMGLGKTIQVIAYLLEKRRGDRSALPALIICPLSVVENWRRELAKFAPCLRVFLQHGADRLNGKRFSETATGQDVVLTTYALAQRDNADLRAVAWGDIIIDEAQNIKNPLIRQTAGIMKLSAPCRLALTGTPVENRLRELWSILQFLNPGYLPPLKEFEQTYSIPIEQRRDVAKQRQLQQLVQPFLLRRLKTDKTIAPDLPDKQETKVYCPLTREQATLYAATLDVMLQQIAEAPPFIRKALIAATLTKLKQICNHPAHFLKDGSSLPRRSGKLIRLLEMLTELKAEGRRALIFTQYTQMGALLERYLQQVFAEPVFFLHGSLPKSQRDRMISDFQESAHAPSFFILSLKAGGVGLNLTRADTVFHYDRWWNPAVENQATDRAFRIGQTRNVQVYKLIATGTLEEKIDDMIESKKQLADSIIGGGETWLSELSITELQKILRIDERNLKD